MIDRFFPTEEVRSLTVGSFEQLVVRVDEAIRSSVAEIFGESIAVELAGTFHGYAIVLAEDGRGARVKWEDDKGVIKLVHHELIQIRSFRQDDVGDYLKTEAKKAVRSLAKGDVAAAMERIKALLPFVQKIPTDRPEAVEALISLHAGDRLWKRLFVEKADVIRRMTLDDLKALQEDRLLPKFRSLYDGKVAASDLENYREVVIENLHNVSTRADNLATQVSTAVGNAKQKTVDEKHSSVVTSLFAFADDLRHDLCSVGKTANEAVRLTKNITSLGRLHDALATDFHDREVAGRFVTKMCERLGNI